MLVCASFARAFDWSSFVSDSGRGGSITRTGFHGYGRGILGRVGHLRLSSVFIRFFSTCSDVIIRPVFITGPKRNTHKANQRRPTSRFPYCVFRSVFAMESGRIVMSERVKQNPTGACLFESLSGVTIWPTGQRLTGHPYGR